MTLAVNNFKFALAGGDTADSVTVDKADNIAVGDLLMILVCNGEHLAGDIFPALTGWTKQFEEGDTNSDSRIGCYTRIATGSENATETITWGTPDRSGMAWYLRIPDPEPTTFWDTQGTTRTVTSATNWGISITPSVNDCLVFTFVGWDGAAEPFTGVSGTNWPSSIPTNQSLQDGPTADFKGVLSSWVTQLQTTAAASNNCTYTVNASDGTVSVQFAIAPSTVTPPSITDINTDENVDDGEQNVTFITSDFLSEVSTAKIVSNDAVETDGSGINSSSGNGDFDLPDVSAYTGDVVGAPLTTTNNTNVCRLGDGSDTADLAINYNPIAGWAVVEIASGVKTEGSIFENFVGSIIDESEVYYSTANNTSVATDGTVTTDSTIDIIMQFWDKADDTWKQLTLLINATGATVSSTLPLLSPLITGNLLSD